MAKGRLDEIAMRNKLKGRAMPKKNTTADIPEIAAMAEVYRALKGLDEVTQRRVLRNVSEILGLKGAEASSAVSNDEHEQREERREANAVPLTNDQDQDPDAEGISPVALKWMKRSDLSSSSLGKLFSVGGDEIDVVAKTVPGGNKKERMRSVILLKGIAAYLATGAARVAHEQVKEACLHYDAFDSTNFAAYLKSFAAEVSGAKEAGYTLTARGMTEATALVKTMVKSNPPGTK